MFRDVVTRGVTSPVKRGKRWSNVKRCKLLLLSHFRLKSIPRLRRALDGANAAVVGLLLAALITPVASSTVAGPWDLPLAALALMALTLRVPPWLVVLVSGAIGPLFGSSF